MGVATAVIPVRNEPVEEDSKGTRLPNVLPSGNAESRECRLKPTLQAEARATRPTEMSYSACVIRYV